MTISANGISRTTACNGVTTVFAVPFQAAETSDILVSLVDPVTYANEAPLSEGADYVISGDVTAGTGVITTNIAYPAGRNLWRRRSTARTQEQVYTPNDGFPAKSHEHVADKQMLVAQEQDARQDDFAMRALQVPIGSVSPAVDLTDLEDGDILQFTGGALRRLDRSAFAGSFYGGDATGRLVPLSGTGADGALRTDLAAAVGAGLVGHKRPVAPAILRGLGDMLDDQPWSLRDLGNIYGDGATDMTTRMSTALQSGARNIVVPPDLGAYVIDGSLVPAAGIKITGEKGHKFLQMMGHMPAFDAVNLDGVEYHGLDIDTTALFAKDTTDMSRGDQLYGLSCGIYASGAHFVIRDCIIRNHVVAVWAASWNGAAQVAGVKGGLIDNLSILNGGQGILVKGRSGLRIRNLKVDTLTLPAGSDDPQHAIYCTGTSAYRNADITIAGVDVLNCLGSVAVQGKYVDGINVRGMLVDGGPVANFYSCRGGNISQIAGVNCTDQNGGGAFVVSYANEGVSERSWDLTISDVHVDMVAGSTRAFQFICDRVNARNIAATMQTATATSNQIVTVGGADNDLDVRVHNKGASGDRSLAIRVVAGLTTTRNRVRLRTNNASVGVVIDSGATATRLSYDPATFSASTSFLNSEGTTTLVRDDCEAAATIAGSTITIPSPAKATRVTVSVPDATNYALTNPGESSASIMPAGTLLAITIFNTSAGALGTLGAGTAYVFKTGTTFTAPAAGKANTQTFRWDGTSKWQEI